MPVGLEEGNLKCDKNVFKKNAVWKWNVWKYSVLKVYVKNVEINSNISIININYKSIGPLIWEESINHKATLLEGSFYIFSIQVIP